MAGAVAETTQPPLSAGRVTAGIRAVAFCVGLVVVSRRNVGMDATLRSTTVDGVTAVVAAATQPTKPAALCSKAVCGRREIRPAGVVVTNRKEEQYRVRHP